MEHNTDRLFWTLTSIIVGALLLTISVKAFPGVAHTVTAPFSGLTKQSDTSTKTSAQAYKDAIGTVNSNSNNSNDNSQNSKPADPKASAVEASTLNLNVTPNGDGTGILTGKVNGTMKGDLNIPEYVKVNGQLTKITSIADRAFFSYAASPSYLTSVTIPNSVTSIGTASFTGNQLTSVTIPNSVTSIGSSAFNSNNLKSIVIPESVNDIGSYAFGDNQLTSANIPNNITTINNGIFQNNQLTSINIPNKVTNIGLYAFENNNLTSITIPKSTESIASNAFQKNKLTSVNIPCPWASYWNAFDSNVTVTHNLSN